MGESERSRFLRRLGPLPALMSVVAAQVACSSSNHPSPDAFNPFDAGYDVMRDAGSYVQFFSVSWSIERQDTFETLTCAQAGAATVQITIDPAPAFSLPCDPQMGPSPVVPAGDYSFSATLLAADQTARSRTQPTPIPLGIGQRADVPIVFVVAP